MTLATTRRIALHLDGEVYDQWSAAEIGRDLGDLSGAIRLELRDPEASAATWPYASLVEAMASPAPGLAATVTIDDEPVLVGWVDDVDTEAGEDGCRVTIAGRDKAGDLIDCAAQPKGPSEYKGLLLDALVRKLVEPFGLAVKVEVDVGEKFDRAVIDAGETVRSAIEKWARQRAVLVVSDGVGGIVLTRSGKTRGPGDLVFPGNVIRSAGRFSWRERFSDYFVQSQAEKGQKLDRTAAPLDARAAPQAEPVKPDKAAEEAGVIITGHYKDQAVGRWRPHVSPSRTTTYKAPAKTVAEWMARTAKAKSRVIEHTAKGFRGPSGGLWKPNQLVFVDDAYAGVRRDMLVRGVVYGFDDQDGETTRLALVGAQAFDLLPEGDSEQDKGGTLDKTAARL
ncbi:Mu P family protein [Rhodoplanes sp. TEM]|uniref:Mu P family protein n=1 Tax=Rhodoplanes tepidamans TaxID=200616 RepID=A0ABT5JE51_RHOTP|nr:MULTISPECIES: Mu P family protein [Rhodoplanes]MDC7787960.1 Mu P family protein [Rhodoplanes tepidamans]MDC7984800.1 Mu P family protein [Rhodoplanes sp. TEM]MDQ0358389.1 prophage tail gpP-like protein [Rhodoplanes tepidamans]